MKKRPSFKVAAIESLETRELLSTTATFRPLQLRASMLASRSASVQPVSMALGANAALNAIRVQGGPSAAFSMHQKANVLAASSSTPRTAYAALLQAAITRRAQRLTPTAFATPAAVSTTPTKLAPSLPFSPVGTSGAGNPFQMMNQTSNARVSRMLLNSSPIVVLPALKTDINIPANSVQTTGPITAASTTTVASSASVLTQSAVGSFKQAVDNFASGYSSGLNATADSSAMTALNSSLAIIGTSSWPINSAVTATAVSGFQSDVNIFAQSYTGGANPTADTAAWNALSGGLGLFSTTPAATATAASTASTPTTTTTTTTTSTSATTAVGGTQVVPITKASTPAATVETTAANQVSPVLTGMLSGIVSSGTLSSDNLTALRNAIDNFASSYTSGANTTADKISTINLVNSLGSIATSQWTKLIAAAAAAKTSVTAPATVTPAPTASASLPTSTSQPTPVATATAATATADSSTTAAVTTAAKTGVLFTAIRAPGV